MKLLFIFLICLPFKQLYSQDSAKVFYFKNINWELIMPGDFKINDSAKDMEMQDRGIKYIEKANDVKVGDLSDLKTLISAYKGRFEYFNSTTRTYDRASEGNYDSSVKVAHRLLYNTFLNELPGANMDTLSSNMSIDGLVFYKFQLSVTVRQKKIFTMVILSKLYKGFDFGISYLYMNPNTNNEIEEMLQQSKFKQ